MKSPRVLYKFPGSTFIDDDKYDFVVVDEAIPGEVERHVSEGWNVSHIDAKQKHINAQTVEENKPPTRAEIEQKANELGLKFDGRTSDVKLLKMIDEALK